MTTDRNPTGATSFNDPGQADPMAVRWPRVPWTWSKRQQIGQGDGLRPIDPDQGDTGGRKRPDLFVEPLDQKGERPANGGEFLNHRGEWPDPAGRPILYETWRDLTDGNGHSMTPRSRRGRNKSSRERRQSLFRYSRSAPGTTFGFTFSRKLLRHRCQRSERNRVRAGEGISAVDRFQPARASNRP